MNIPNLYSFRCLPYLRNSTSYLSCFSRVFPLIFLIIIIIMLLHTFSGVEQEGGLGGGDLCLFCVRSYMYPISNSFFALIPQSWIYLLRPKLSKLPPRCLDTSFQSLLFEIPGCTAVFFLVFHIFPLIFLIFFICFVIVFIFLLIFLIIHCSLRKYKAENQTDILSDDGFVIKSKYYSLIYSSCFDPYLELSKMSLFFGICFILYLYICLN